MLSDRTEWTLTEEGRITDQLLREDRTTYGPFRAMERNRYLFEERNRRIKEIKEKYRPAVYP